MDRLFLTLGNNIISNIINNNNNIINNTKSGMKIDI